MRDNIAKSESEQDDKKEHFVDKIKRISRSWKVWILLTIFSVLISLVSLTVNLLEGCIYDCILS